MIIVSSSNLRSLLGIISAFTVAHSTTLVLSALEIISLNPTVTETLIAASIAYVGIENVVMPRLDHRWLVAGLFGLIHGAGFSSHLIAILKSTMGAGEVWVPLAGFNIGIELGQMLVVCLLVPLFRLLQKTGKSELLISEISRMVAAVGLFLVVSRIWEL